MIAEFALGPKRRAVLGDDGEWTSDPPGDPMLSTLNDRFSPTNSPGEVGDHHRPWGVPEACRAADWFRAEVVIHVPPYPPLPPGVVS